MKNRYKAFISYSHSDEAWARWLHRKLEHYRLPRSVRNGAQVGGGDLRPIFRDRDELASSGSLNAAILDALQRSDALIVICSPAAAKSRWVNQEISEFCRVQRADRVHAVGQRTLGDEAALVRAAGVEHRIQRAGNLFSPVFAADGAHDYASAVRQESWRYGPFFHELLARGVYAPPSAFEAWFVSAAHDDTALSRIADALPHAARAAAAAPSPKDAR